MEIDVILSHASGGDGLTVWQEYRGYIVDGGPGFTGTRHVSLSPFRKELLVQVSAPELASLMAEAGYGDAANTNALSAFDVDNIMLSVAELYADMSRGAGIDLYWVNRELNPLPIGGSVSYGNGYGRPDAFRYDGQMFYEPDPPVFPNDLTGTAQIVDDLPLLNILKLPAYRQLFKGEDEIFKNEITNNRDPSLKGFIPVVFKARAAMIEARDGNTYAFRSNLCRAYLLGNVTEQGAIILTTNVSEENPFAYGQQHYNQADFISFLAWAVAHEIAHLIGCDDMLNPASGSLMGLRTLIGGTTISSTELSQINRNTRKGVTQ